ncbi:unnamed protein product [Alopecurus aequalis]
MASKAALPALLLLALLCGQLVTDGHAQEYSGARGLRPLPYARGGSSAGMLPPAYTRTRGGSSAGYDDGTRGLSVVEEEKAFMMPSLPARERPVPVPPTSN